MTEKKLYLILQSALCVLLVILLAASAVSICREGVARREEDPLAPIYTPEKAAAKLNAVAPLLFVSIGMTAAGRILGVKDESTDRPAEDAELARGRRAAGVRPKLRAGARAKNGKAKRVLQLAVIVAALVFLLLGVINGSAKAVHTKAANICTECVGLG